MEDDLIDGPPPLQTEDHFHVFFYHSSAPEDMELIDHYVSIMEARYVERLCAFCVYCSSAIEVPR